MTILRHILLTGCLTSLIQCVVIAKPASVATISPTDLIEYEEQPEVIRELIDNALELTKKNLTYLFGSNSLANAGMDCSGTIQCTLKSIGVADVPRSSYHFYQWAKGQSTLTTTRGVETVEDPVFENLKPGDLLFWEGTYETGKQSPPISHVMIYLGKLKEDGRGVVFGASDGRRYRGKKITGVSVFDWKVPPASSRSKFVGYASIPGLELGAEPDPESEKESEGPLKSLKSGLEKLFQKRETSSR